MLHSPPQMERSRAWPGRISLDIVTANCGKADLRVFTKTLCENSRLQGPMQVFAKRCLAPNHRRLNMILIQALDEAW